MTKTLVGLITDYVRRNPRTSAMVAFNLGLYAAMAATQGLRRSDLKNLRGKLVELVPSMGDLTSLLSTAAPAPKQRPRRAAGRKAKSSARRSRRKAAA